MIAVMGRSPLLPTNIAKLVLASACYVVAALVLLNHKVAFLALSIVQVVLHEKKFLFVTIPLMDPQQAFPAKLFPACVAY